MDFQGRERRYGGLTARKGRRDASAKRLSDECSFGFWTAVVLIPAVVALVWWGPLPLLAAISRRGSHSGAR